ncbi:hypothetical protein L3Y34_010420 [Caenorhabditis briggsae]|uniref:SET domain-containing protein n=1 Tax=Caenorhabditis briggsae TaxID=6238 RepID=A0AAE8ZLH4_CAEBR|nr:hypothetical protein L3Y34_010420 [Caenorhabditis briggsae]
MAANQPDETTPDTITLGQPNVRTVAGVLIARNQPVKPEFAHLARNESIQMGHIFTNPIPAEDRLGALFYSRHNYPGIPRRKMTANEVAAHKKNYEWKVQTTYTNIYNQLLCTYVGWNSTAAFVQLDARFRRENQEVLGTARQRDAYLRSIQRDPEATDEMKQATRMWLSMGLDLLNTPHHLFWLYEDLSYYHTKIHRVHDLPPLIYLCLRRNLVMPPRFKYTIFNVVEESAMDVILSAQSNKSVDELQKSYKKKLTNAIDTACESPNTCQCNKLWHMLYAPQPGSTESDAKYMTQNGEGRLDMTDFDVSDLRVVIECSDTCGCSSECPRRCSQRGQTKMLLVRYENEFIDFALRAAEPIRQGEFIVEYNGLVTQADTGTRRDESYDVALNLICPQLVINSSAIGNLSRFMAHGCQPNAALIETHSRVKDKDPLVPRVSVYAIKDIAAGEKVEISYYQEEQLKSKDGYPCKCRPGCTNTLPRYY